MQNWYLLDEKEEVFVYRSCLEKFIAFFKVKNDLAVSHESHGLQKGIKYIPNEKYIPKDS